MTKNAFAQKFDALPWIIKLLLCLPFLNFLWGIYRIIKGATENKKLTLLFGILWIIPGGPICWMIDLVCILIFKKPMVFA